MFIEKPLKTNINNIKNKNFSLHPGDFRNFNIKNRNTKKISQLVIEENVGSQIDVQSYLPIDTGHYLINISCMEGLLINEKIGEFISPNAYKYSSKKLKKGDLIVSRNASLGKVSYLTKDINAILNGGLSYLRVDEKYRYYLMAFFICRYGEQFLINLTSGGGTQQNAKREDLLNIDVPFPTKENNDDPSLVERKISLIVKNIIDKEEQIKNKNRIVDESIQKELLLEENKVIKNKNKISDIRKNNFKLDSSVYGSLVKTVNNSIENYKNGFFILNEYYNYSRGQNLQISQIGESIYSNEFKKGFYKLVTNVEMQDNRTISGHRFLGNPNRLTTIPKRAILFAADGAIVGRTIYFDSIENTITNLHPWVITSKDENCDTHKIVFTSLFLSFLKNTHYLEKIKDKSNGGGLKGEHLEKWIKIPKFDDYLQKEIAKEYFNDIPKIYPDLEDYLFKEKERNKNLGIYQLNMEIFLLKKILEDLIYKIVMGLKVEIKMDY